jgi:hypothetical protein
VNDPSVQKEKIVPGDMSGAAGKKLDENPGSQKASEKAGKKSSKGARARKHKKK